MLLGEPTFVGGMLPPFDDAVVKTMKVTLQQLVRKKILKVESNSSIALPRLINLIYEKHTVMLSGTMHMPRDDLFKRVKAFGIERETSEELKEHIVTDLIAAFREDYEKIISEMYPARVVDGETGAQVMGIYELLNPSCFTPNRTTRSGSKRASPCDLPPQPPPSRRPGSAGCSTEAQ